MQVTILTPSVGSKGYEEPYEKGMVIEQAGDHKVEDYQYDGNHCIATDDPHPWRKQLNIYMAYASFYNPLNFVRAIANWKDPLWNYRVMYQAYGMVGLVKSVDPGLGLAEEPVPRPGEEDDQPPRQRLLMVPPPVTPATAPVAQYQTA